MKVKTIADVYSRIGMIDSGWTFEAESLNQFFVIKDGFLKGAAVPKLVCEVVQETYTEKEVKAIEDVHIAKLNKEREQKERAQQLVRELTEQINLKDKKIIKLDFFMNAYMHTLNLATQKLKELRKAQNG
jgi:hypothetical protein